jgi:hypothetical protein
VLKVTVTMERIGYRTVATHRTSMDLFFWLLLNLCVPLAGPVSLLALFSLTHGYGVARELIVESVRCGRLLWSAISLSAAANYEAITWLEVRGPTPMLELSIAAHCVIGCACATLIMVMTTVDREERRFAQSRASRVRAPSTLLRSRLVLVSIVLVCGVAVTFASTHIYSN